MDNITAIIPRKMSVFNIFSGIQYNITVDTTIPTIEVLLLLAEITKLQLKNRVFIYDLETQGLDKYRDEIL